jgi:hypothetical protein
MIQKQYSIGQIELLLSLTNLLTVATMSILIHLQIIPPSNCLMIPKPRELN